MADEEMVRCPYDRNHLMLKKTYPKHIIRCLKNFPTSNKKQCPFNSTHMVEELEFDHHVATCEDSANFRRYTESLESNVPLNIINVKDVNNIQVPSTTEKWNENQKQIKKYDPIKESEKKSVIRPVLSGAKKSDRKLYKQQEIERFNTLENTTAISTTQQAGKVKNNNDEKLRWPQHPPEALLSDKTDKFNTTITNNAKAKASDYKNGNSNYSTCSTNYNDTEVKYTSDTNDVSKLLSTVNLEDRYTQTEQECIDEKQSFHLNNVDSTVNSTLENTINSPTYITDKINIRIELLSRLEEEIKLEKTKLYQQLHNLKQSNQSTNPFKTKNIEMPRCNVGRGSALAREMYKRSETADKPQSGQIMQAMSYAQITNMSRTAEYQQCSRNQPYIPEHNVGVFYGYEDESEDNIDDKIENI